MGVINRRAFASSQTGTPGTPGLDFSTARGLASAASGFDAVAAQIQRNKEPLNQLEAIRLSQDIDLDFNQAVGKVQKDFATNSNLDPADYPQIVDKIFNASVKGGLSSIKDKRVRQLVELNQQKSRGGKLSKANEFALGQQGIKLKTTLEQNQNEDTFIASGLGSMGELALHLRNVEANVVAGSQGLSAKEAARISIDYPKANVQAYVSGKIDKDPSAGYEEFRTEPFFAGFFDEKEREEVEEQFLFKITGERERAKFGALLQGYAPLNRLIEDDNLVGDAPALVEELNAARNFPVRNSELETTLENMIIAARKQTDLNPKIKALDSSVLVKLEVQEDSINRTIENGTSEEVLQAAATLVSDTKAAQSNGEISQTQANGLLIPAGELMQEITEVIKTSEVKDSSKDLFQGLGGFLIGKHSPVALAFRAVFKNFFTHPVRGGIRKVDSKLAPVNITDSARATLRGNILTDFYEQMANDKKIGTEITDQRVDAILTNIYNEHLPNAGLDIAEDTDIVYDDPVTGFSYIQLPNGNYQRVK